MSGIFGGDVRPATEADLYAISAIHARSWQTAFRGVVPDEILEARTPENSLAQWKEIHGTFPQNIAVFEGGDVVRGFICAGAILHPERKSLFGFEVHALHAHPDMRGRGVGSALLRRALASASRQGLSAVVWTLEALNPSRRFYERMGGVLVERREWRPSGYRIPEVAYGWSPERQTII